MKSLQARINHYQSRLTQLQSRLTELSKGISAKLRKTAIKIIFEIERIEKVLSQLKTVIATITLTKLKNQSRTWCAKLSPERDTKFGGFCKTFFEPVSKTFDKRGEKTADYDIPVDLKAVYQDSMGDFWIFINPDGDTKIISYKEAAYRLQGGTIG